MEFAVHAHGLFANHYLTNLHSGSRKFSEKTGALSCEFASWTPLASRMMRPRKTENNTRPQAWHTSQVP